MRTSYNPDFMISNMLRDLQTALINLSEYDQKGLRSKVMATALPAMNGVRKALRSGDMTSDWGKVFHEFQHYGGHTAIMGIKELADTVADINKTMGEDASGAPGKVWKQVKRVGKFIEDYNLAIENGTRLAAYRALRDKYLELSGDPTLPANQKRAKEMAAFAAKKLTVDFNMGGESKSVMSALYMFYNASMQGSMAMINPFIRSRKMKKIWGGVLLAGIAQDIMMSMLSATGDDGEKEYDRIPDYVLEHNMVFMDPFGISERGYFKIPMPYLMNSIYNWGRSISRAARGKYTAGQLLHTGGMTMLDSLNPWGGTEQFAQLCRADHHRSGCRSGTERGFHRQADCAAGFALRQHRGQPQPAILEQHQPGVRHRRRLDVCADRSQGRLHPRRHGVLTQSGRVRHQLGDRWHRHVPCAWRWHSDECEQG